MRLARGCAGRTIRAFVAGPRMEKLQTMGKQSRHSSRTGNTQCEASSKKEPGAREPLGQGRQGLHQQRYQLPAALVCMKCFPYCISGSSRAHGYHGLVVTGGLAMLQLRIEEQKEGRIMQRSSRSSVVM